MKPNETNDDGSRPAAQAGERDGWVDLGPVDSLKDPPVRRIVVGEQRLALSFRDGRFGVVSSVCNHVGGPLGHGTLDGDYLVCPWHHYKFHRCTGAGEPGYEDDRVPGYAVEVREGRLFLDPKPRTKRHRLPHDPHPLAREPRREPGALRVAGISTTQMDREYPRYSTSEALLEVALGCAKEQHGAETQLIRLDSLKFRNCEGYYSKGARACTWPCSITQMDSTDQLDRVYEAIVHWADVVLVATPIRWGAASSLYYKMVERMNCIQNQITLHNKVLIRNKVAAFIITGGQDNVQAVAGQMMMFFGEIGFVFPPFPFVAHSLGWTAENMEANVEFVQQSEGLRKGTRDLVERSLRMARDVVDTGMCAGQIERGGRKANR